MLIVLLFSSLLAISSSSWLIIWVFIEINSLAICSLISNEINNESENNNQALMYLVIQLTSSIIFLLCINSVNSNNFLLLICIVCLIIKSGVWPFHLWYINTLSLININHNTIAIIITWQNIIPIILLPFITLNTALTVIALGSLITPITNINNTSSFNTIIVSSSLNNNAWLILSTLVSSFFFTIYLTIYSSSLFITFKFFNTLNTNSTLNTNNFWESMITLGNIGGVPPLIIFMGNILIFSILIQTENPNELLILIILIACFFIYHYIWSTICYLTNIPTNTQIWNNDLSTAPQVTLLISATLIWFLMFLGFT